MAIPDSCDNPFDEALTRRLRQLDTLPVDTGSLDQRLRQAIIPARTHSRRWSVGILTGAAAMLMIGLMVLSELSTSPARASVGDLTRIYQSMLSGSLSAVSMNSPATAGTAMARACVCLPGLKMSGMKKVKSCCLTQIHQCNVSCLLLKNHSKPVVVLTGNRLLGPAGRPVTFNGIAYQVVAANKLNLVESSDQGRWICLIGRSSPSELLKLASRLY